MKTTWQANWNPSKIYPTLAGDMKADVVIIGGGLAGITTAYLLSKAGKKVVVLEKKFLAESVTAYTTAFISWQTDTAFHDLKRIFGSDRAELICKAGEKAIDQIEKIINEEAIDCEFARCPQYELAANKNDLKNIAKEAEALNLSGFNLEISKNKIVLPNQAKFHPLKYADGLRRAAEKNGALFFENTEAREIKSEKQIQAITGAGIVSAEWAILSTHNPFNKPMELYGKKGVYISYILELSIQANLLSEGLYVDAKNPYHYFRVDKNGARDRLIIGGEDHRKEIPIDHSRNFTALEEYAEKILGESDYNIVTHWSGPILETWDGIPFIGSYSKKHPNYLVATGFSGNGMTYSMVSAHILTDTILKKENKYANVFHPRRGYSITAAVIKGRDYFVAFLFGALANFFKKKKRF
jgi:glycine/D-amino acid oxidase-like deaminating enzyme